MAKLAPMIARAALAALLMLAASPALAGSMDGLFGNTLKVTAANGATSTYAYDRGGEVTAVVRGHPVSGHWRLEEATGRICQAFSPEPEVTMPEVCVALQTDGKKAGDKWSGVSPAGRPLTFEIVAGH